MALLIQRAETRDTQALQAKMDELIRASEAAREGVGPAAVTTLLMVPVARRLEAGAETLGGMLDRHRSRP